MNEAKVMWWSERDGNGILVDNAGNEYYFDKSVYMHGDSPKRGELMHFEINSKIADCLCAKDVTKAAMLEFLENADIMKELKALRGE